MATVGVKGLIIFLRIVSYRHT